MAQGIHAAWTSGEFRRIRCNEGGVGVYDENLRTEGDGGNLLHAIVYYC